MKKVNVFFVGYPKSGSTSLYFYLKENPEIFLPEAKEPIFFSSDLRKEFFNFNKDKKSNRYSKISSFEDYTNLYKQANKKKYLADFSTSYIVSKTAAKNIKKYNPNAKIIITLREPSDFLESLYRHLFWGGNENQPTFEKALKIESERKKGNFIPKNVEYPSKLFYSKYIQYEKSIKRFLNEFTNKNILVLFTEDMKKDNAKTLERIYDFLQIKKKTFPEKYKIYNTKKNIRFKKLYSTINCLPFISKISKFVPKKIKSLFFSNQKEDNSKIKKDLKRKYYNDVVELEKFLKKEKLIEKEKDLVKLWGYDKIEK